MPKRYRNGAPAAAKKYQFKMEEAEEEEEEYAEEEIRVLNNNIYFLSIF